MKFEKDVFISYAHLDDKPLDEGAKGWITDFHSLLETRLEQTIGYEIEFWRDNKLTGNEVFAAEIESKLPTLKLMVSIVTPRYLDSDWCKREMGDFYAAAQNSGGISVGNKSRIFKIVKTPVDREVIENLPEGIHQIFDEILDYKFYIQEAATGKFKELSRSSWVENTIKQEYMNKLDDVVQDMANLIKLLNKPEAQEIEKKKIYLAETTYDLQVYRDNLVREFQEAGFIVLPDKNLPYDVGNFIENVQKYIDASLLSIHLISSTNYAVQPEGADKSSVMIQNEIAAKKSAKAKFNRVIWIPPATEQASTNEKMVEKQEAFVNALNQDTELQIGADILVGPLEECKQVIFDTIKRMDAEEKARQGSVLREIEKAQEKKDLNPAVAVGNLGPKLIYLICDQRDLDTTRQLEDFLTGKGNEILLPLFEGDQAQLRQAHLENLKICDAIVIYYGAGNFRWVGSMKSDLMRLPAMGRENPLLEKAIFIAGPPDDDKENFKANDIEIINGLDGFEPGLLDNFIQNLK